MQKIKKVIILLIILLSITIIALIINLMNVDDYDQNQVYATEDVQPTEYELQTTLKVVEDKMNYYAIKDIVDKYYLYYATVFNIQEYYETDDTKMIKEAELQNADILYSILDEEYIHEKDVTASNIKTKLEKIESSTINITNMYVSEKNDKIDVYLVKGILKGKNTEKINPFKIIIKVDVSNRTYSVIPQEYVEEKYNNLEAGHEIDVTVLEGIQKSKNNIFNYKAVSDEVYIKSLFSKFKNELQYFTEQAYNNLEPEYKNKNFQTLQVFKEYIENHKSEYNKMQLAKYQKKEIANYTQYIFIDQNNNYYILRETEPFAYTVMLDNYTIPTAEFTEEYNTKSDSEKVILNIKRFFMGIDDKNYGYSYSVLSEGFKSNKYPSKNDFINYVKQNFFEENKIEYISYEKENNLYIYNIKVSDATGKNNNTKELSVIVRLNSGTDFEMSFGTN